MAPWPHLSIIDSMRIQYWALINFSNGKAYVGIHSTTFHQVDACAPSDTVIDGPLYSKNKLNPRRAGKRGRPWPSGRSGGPARPGPAARPGRGRLRVATPTYVPTDDCENRPSVDGRGHYQGMLPAFITNSLNPKSVESLATCRPWKVVIDAGAIWGRPSFLC
jgi:hypothetical protein